MQQSEGKKLRGLNTFYMDPPSLSHSPSLHDLPTAKLLILYPRKWQAPSARIPNFLWIVLLTVL